MYVWMEKIVRWKQTKEPHPAVVCALCGRRMQADEPCISAIWAAQAGQYVQAFHPTCAYIVKLWGYPANFLDPKAAETWAKGFSCNSCPQRITCTRYVFDCQRAIEAIRLLGGVQKYEEGEHG